MKSSSIVVPAPAYRQNRLYPGGHRRGRGDLRQYAEQFGTNKPMLEQFFIYVGNVFRGDFGYSFSQYPRTVASVVSSSIGWTIMLALPAIIIGWILGNVLGVLAAYRRGGFDKVLMPGSLFMSSLPSSAWSSFC